MKIPVDIDWHDVYCNQFTFKIHLNMTIRCAISDGIITVFSQIRIDVTINVMNRNQTEP